MLATLIGFSAILLWSSLAVLTAASGAVPPFELAALTFAIGGCLGLAATAARGRLAAFRQPPAAWLLGVGGLFGYHALYFAALQKAPPAQAGLIAYLWPLLIVLLSATLPDERLQARHVVGALLGLSGVAVLLLRGGEGGFSARYAWGYGLAALCAVVWSAYSVLSRRMRDVPTDAVGGFCLATAALAFVAHLVFERTVIPASGAQIAAVLFLGIGPVGLAFYAWDHGVKRGDIRLLGVASYGAPVLSTLLLVLSGNAAVTGALAGSTTLIVLGALVASLGRRANPVVSDALGKETAATPP